MDWDKLRIFHAVAEAGSFTHAGDVLNLSQSAVSRQISALEEALQVPLFHRHARGLILTEQGEAMNRTVREVFAKLAMTEALLTESKEKAAGRLKVTTTTAFGGAWLTPRLPAFFAAHPDIIIALILEDVDLDLGMREADVAIRMHPPRQPDLVQRHLADIHMPACASADYLAAHGTPASPEELDQHRLVLFGSYHPPAPDMDWLATIGKPAGQRRTPTLEVNNLAAMADAVAAGLGIGSLPHYIVNERPSIRKVLAQVKVPIVEAYFVYPEELRTSKRVAVFRDFLLSEMQARN
ncbi:LysR family transcriptional regulator [Lichenicoccus sp.]|uniref:LysR family transcriptional regulator n=1 Tax=Lichenicoccus sp. TaxID=2781899 RepID=UPI003D0F2087